MEKEKMCIDDSAFLADIRPQMIRFANLQLQDEHLAEDVVHDALAGALKNASSFGRKSALKTWVFAILKNKITDILRKHYKQGETEEPIWDDQGYLDSLFNRRGFWQREELPQAWPEPAESVKKEHFWRVFEICLGGLPDSQARPFMMREFLELETEEICQSLDISVSNLHVILYRARLRLRKCLENRWFIDGECTDEL